MLAGQENSDREGKASLFIGVMTSEAFGILVLTENIRRKVLEGSKDDREEKR